MKNLKIVFTLEIQDGENRYKLNSPQEVSIDGNKSEKEQINEFGEELAKTYYDNTSTEINDGDWYEIDGGFRVIRYKSFEIIEDEKTFLIIKNILYK